MVARYRLPTVFAMRDYPILIEGNEHSTRAQQPMVSLAFNTSARAARVFANGGWTYTDPQLPQDQQWVLDGMLRTHARPDWTIGSSSPFANIGSSPHHARASDQRLDERL